MRRAARSCQRLVPLVSTHMFFDFTPLLKAVPQHADIARSLSACPVSIPTRSTTDSDSKQATHCFWCLDSLLCLCVSQHTDPIHLHMIPKEGAAADPLMAVFPQQPMLLESHAPDPASL